MSGANARATRALVRIADTLEDINHKLDHLIRRHNDELLREPLESRLRWAQ